jgi:CheY-like chemotaxis protein
MNEMSDMLRILVVHREQETARALLAELEKSERPRANAERYAQRYASHTVHIATTLEDATAAVLLVQPHIVFLDLNLGGNSSSGGESFTFLEHYAPSERRFAVILLDDEDGAPSLRQRHSEAQADYQASGYLLYPATVHRVFAESLAKSIGTGAESFANTGAG